MDCLASDAWPGLVYFWMITDSLLIMLTDAYSGLNQLTY
jgi:hypothetical protein